MSSPFGGRALSKSVILFSIFEGGRRADDQDLPDEKWGSETEEKT